MKRVSFWLALLGAGALLSACAQTDFDVKVPPPDAPVTSMASISQPGRAKVSVVGAEKLNFVLNPLTIVCSPINFKVAYADAATNSIKQAIAGAANTNAGSPRSFTVTIADFNARVMSLLVDPFVFRHDAEVRVTLLSREDVAGGPAIEKAAGASIYHESPRDDSGFCDKGQDALAYALHKVMSDALADLASGINTGEEASPASANNQSPHGS